jgi:hypothetical protein
MSIRKKNYIPVFTYRLGTINGLLDNPFASENALKFYTDEVEPRVGVFESRMLGWVGWSLWRRRMEKKYGEIDTRPGSYDVSCRTAKQVVYRTILRNWVSLQKEIEVIKNED